MSPYLAELLGTFIMIGLGHAINANLLLVGTKGMKDGWLTMSLGWGMAVFCAVSVAGPYSGAHLNPAVTLGLAMAGLFRWADVFLFIAMQFIGAGLGALLIWINFKDHFNKESDPKSKLGVFSTSPQIRNLPINFINEATGSFMLVFVIFYFSEPSLTSSSIENAKLGLGSIGALPVGILVMVIGAGIGGTTGFAINPARDLAPRVMHAILPIKGKGNSDWSYAWIPVLAPIAGAVMAGILFRFL